MADTRQKLLENFDAEVHDRLKVNFGSSRQNIGRAQELLWRLSKQILDEHASFDDEARCFTVTSVPSAVTECDVGDAFHLGNRPVAHSHKYRLGHPIAQWVLEAAKQRPTPDSSIVFDYSAWNVNAVALESFVGCTGSLVVEKLVVAGSEMEEHLLLVAVTDDQRSLDPEATRRMLELPADVTTERRGAALGSTAAIDALDTRRSEVLADLADRQATWFDQEIDKFDRWADDQRHALRAELKDLDAEIKDLKRSGRTAGALPEKLALQRKIRDAESRRDGGMARIRRQRTGRGS